MFRQWMRLPRFMENLLARNFPVFYQGQRTVNDILPSWR